MLQQNITEESTLNLQDDLSSTIDLEDNQFELCKRNVHLFFNIQ